MPIPYVKCRAYGIHGVYYIEHLKFEVKPWMTYFFTAQDYTFDTIRRITNKGTLLKYLEAYYRHNFLYGEDIVTEKIEEVIDHYIQDYLENVSDTSFRLGDERKFIYFDDVSFHPQDYPRSILAHPSISDYYFRQEDNIRDNLKQRFINEDWEIYVDQVLDVFINDLKDLIRDRTKVIWEVPHTIYKSKEPFTDEDIRTGKVKPYIHLDKYEHEFFDYEIGFHERIYYKLVEHLPSGDYIMNYNWERSNYIKGIQVNPKSKSVRSRSPKQNFFANTSNGINRYGQESLPENWSVGEDPMIDHEGTLCEFYLPFPVIAARPSMCRGGPHTRTIRKYEGRFKNTMSWGGMHIPCIPAPGSNPVDLIHPINHYYKLPTKGNDDYVPHIRITGKVGGIVNTGDTVILSIYGKTYTGLVEYLGGDYFTYSIYVALHLLNEDNTIDVSVTTTDDQGNLVTATGTRDTILETFTHTSDNSASITIDPIVEDVYNYTYNDTLYIRTSASTYAGSLWYELEGSADIRDYEPPKILYTDEWYTEEHFGEYPSLKYDYQKEWWKEYRQQNIQTKNDWNSFWGNKMTTSKEDLIWYINTHIDRENKI